MPPQNALHSLKTALEEGFALRIINAPEQNAILPITRTLTILRQACDQRNEGALPPGATHALFAFRMGEPIQDFLALKQLCATASKTAGWDSRRLIDDPRLFAKLLEQVMALRTEPKSFGKCYRALLSSYFSYPASSPEASIVGRNNWQALGDFLRSHLDTVCTTAHAAHWASTLRENAELLNMPPPAAINAADTEKREAIRRQLGIPARRGLFAHGENA